MQGKNIPCNLYSNYFERLTAKKKIDQVIFGMRRCPGEVRFILWGERVGWGRLVMEFDSSFRFMKG